VTLAAAAGGAIALARGGPSPDELIQAVHDAAVHLAAECAAGNRDTIRIATAA
jgi:hypothetical protein